MPECTALSKMSKLKKLSHHHDRTPYEKTKILQYIDEQHTMKKKNIAADFDIQPQTFSNLLKNSNKI